MPLTLLVGGARSGKSTLALGRAQRFGGPVVFVATAEPRDAEMAERIARHRAERDAGWTTVEAPVDLAGALSGVSAETCVIVDCLTLWVANLIERELDHETLAIEAAGLAARRPGPTIAVTNEVGMGVVPASALGRRYRDALGRVNAIWADHAAEALLVVAGRTLRLDRATPPSPPFGRPIASSHRAAAPFDRRAAAAARAALDGKAKPRGSLGRVEDLAVRIAGIRGEARPGRLVPAVVVCAADHGIAREGVSAYPQEVTGQMLRTFARGGAAVCVLARQAGARLVVADLGVREPIAHPAILDRRVRAGTANAVLGPAMMRDEAERAVAVGLELADDLARDGVGLVALGEMGIGNTTAASALTSALLGTDPDTVCGPGTGLDAAGLARKRAVVRRALAANEARLRRPHDVVDPLNVLAAVGGLEIAALAGLTLGCAANRTPVLVDGFITAAAALAAVRLEPASRDVLIAAHRSPEPGHTMILDALGLEPLLDLGMRLGEGSGAALALPLVAAAVSILTEMASLEEAGVADRTARPEADAGVTDAGA